MRMTTKRTAGRGPAGWLSRQLRVRPRPMWLVCLMHAVALGLALVLYALPHHVIPHGEAAVGVVSSRGGRPARAQAATPYQESDARADTAIDAADGEDAWSEGDLSVDADDAELTGDDAPDNDVPDNDVPDDDVPDDDVPDADIPDGDVADYADLISGADGQCQPGSGRPRRQEGLPSAVMDVGRCGSVPQGNGHPGSFLSTAPDADGLVLLQNHSIPEDGRESQTTHSEKPPG